MGSRWAPPRGLANPSEDGVTRGAPPKPWSRAETPCLAWMSHCHCQRTRVSKGDSFFSAPPDSYRLELLAYHHQTPLIFQEKFEVQISRRNPIFKAPHEPNKAHLQIEFLDPQYQGQTQTLQLRFLGLFNTNGRCGGKNNGPQRCLHPNPCGLRMRHLTGHSGPGERDQVRARETGGLSRISRWTLWHHKGLAKREAGDARAKDKMLPKRWMGP